MADCLLEVEVVHTALFYSSRLSDASFTICRRSVNYRRSLSRSPTDAGKSEKGRGRTNRRFSETALMYLAEDYSTQLSNNEPRFIKSNTSLANSSNELDCYTEMNNYLDNETKGRMSRAQSVEILALEEESTLPLTLPLPEPVEAANTTTRTSEGCRETE